MPSNLHGSVRIPQSKHSTSEGQVLGYGSSEARERDIEPSGQTSHLLSLPTEVKKKKSFNIYLVAIRKNRLSI